MKVAIVGSRGLVWDRLIVDEADFVVALDKENLPL